MQNNLQGIKYIFLPMHPIDFEKIKMCEPKPKWIFPFNWSHHIRWHSHCTFSWNLCHCQITKKYINLLNAQEDKKCSPWKVLGINLSQTPPLLSRRHEAVSSLNITLAHKWNFVIFHISTEKSFLVENNCE